MRFEIDEVAWSARIKKHDIDVTVQKLGTGTLSVSFSAHSPVDRKLVRSFGRVVLSRLLPAPTR